MKLKDKLMIIILITIVFVFLGIGFSNSKKHLASVGHLYDNQARTTVTVINENYSEKLEVEEDPEKSSGAMGWIFNIPKKIIDFFN